MRRERKTWAEDSDERGEGTEAGGGGLQKIALCTSGLAFSFSNVIDRCWCGRAWVDQNVWGWPGPTQATAQRTMETGTFLYSAAPNSYLRERKTEKKC